jgi:hypothetical protein
MQFLSPVDLHDVGALLGAPAKSRGQTNESTKKQLKIDPQAQNGLARRIAHALKYTGPVINAAILLVALSPSIPKPTAMPSRSEPGALFHKERFRARPMIVPNGGNNIASPGDIPKNNPPEPLEWRVIWISTHTNVGDNVWTQFGAGSALLKMSFDSLPKYTRRFWLAKNRA